MDILFWIFSVLVVAGASSVLLLSNPIYSALALALTMIGIAGHFVLLDAHFLAAVQLAVYAGAVMVLFIMVLMLFDLESEKKAFSAGVFKGFLKIALAGWLCGMIAFVAMVSVDGVAPPDTPTDGLETKNLATLLITKHVFGFEAIGVLLLIVAVGTVTLARSKGGTHGN